MADSDPPQPASKEDLVGYNYSDLQALAADLDYGRIVGVERADLVAYIVDEMALDCAPALPEPEQSDSQIDSGEQRDGQPDQSEPEPEKTTEGGTETSEPDAVTVSHEGTEKLSPAGFEDESISSIDPPEGVELPKDVGPDDFEPEPEESTIHRDSHADRRDQEPSADPDPNDSETDRGNSGGGLLSRIRGDKQRETTDDVVDDAHDSAERQRREQVLDALRGAGPTQGQPREDHEGQPETSAASGIVMDADLVAQLFGMPFEQAAAATGWDGWALTDAERKANARLIVAYCEEQNIDLSTGGMLAMSLMSTVGGRMAGYARHRKQQREESAVRQREPADEEPEPAPEPEPEPERIESDSHLPGPVARASADNQPARQSAGDVAKTDGGQRDDFDFSDSSTW